MSRNKNEKPLRLAKDKVHFPLRCDGNGNKDCQYHAPTCKIKLALGEVIWIAAWKTSPKQTVHCDACKTHFFEEQSTLPFTGKKGRTP